jgi:hypothetical protein
MLSLILYGYVCYQVIQILFDISDYRQRKADKDPLHYMYL